MHEPIAPCGHKGYYVVGWYVHCEQCDKSKPKPQVKDKSRFKPGHTVRYRAHLEPTLPDSLLGVFKIVPVQANWLVAVGCVPAESRSGQVYWLREDQIEYCDPDTWA